MAQLDGAVLETLLHRVRRWTHLNDRLGNKSLRGRMCHVSRALIRPDTTDVFLRADDSGQSALIMKLIGVVGLILTLAACVPGRPDRLLGADATGLVSDVNNPVGAERTVELEDGRVIEVPRNSTALFGSGISPWQLLLFGEDYGRSWYARLPPDDLSAVDGCYGIAGVAYDEPDAVIIVSGEWRGVGLRLPKRDDFELPANVVDAQGVYRMATEYPEGRFCVDTTGSVFALP